MSQRFAHLPAGEVTAGHLVGTLCRSLDELVVASDGITAVIPFEGAKPRGLYGTTTRTDAEHRAWLLTLPPLEANL